MIDRREDKTEEKELIINPIFSERLKQTRKEKSVNQKDLADYLSVGRTSISNWEIGRATPRIYMIVKISEFFGVSADYLLGMVDKQHPHIEHDQNDIA